MMAVQDLWRDRHGNPTRRDGRGKRYRVSVPGWPTTACRTKAEADRLYAMRLSSPPPSERSSATVADAVDIWLDGKRGLSPRGYTACRGDARHVKAEWGRRDPDSITRSEVQAWIASMTAVKGGVERPASRALRSRCLSCLRGALTVAQERGWARTVATAGVSVPRQDRREPRPLTPAQLRKLAYACHAPGAGAKGRGWWAPLVMLLGTAGLRIGEAAALTVGDVSVETGRIRVRRSKSGRGRDVAVPSSVLAMLDLDRGDDEVLFVGPHGGALDPDVWRRRAFAAAVEDCGLHGLRIHDLRHTAASLAIRAGASVMDVQHNLGHSRASTTLDIYAHLLDDGLDDVAARVGKMLS